MLSGPCTDRAGVIPRRIVAPLLLIGLLLAVSAPPARAQNSSTATTSTLSNPQNAAAVEARVREYFADLPVMAAIAKCESRFRQFNEGGTVLFDPTYSWMGVFQISRIHLPRAISLNMDIKTLEGNMTFARILYNESGTQPWNSSKHCWGGASASGNSGSLTLGSKDARVREVQKMLNRTGFTIAAAGPGSPGAETTMFGSLTREAVRRFQCAKGIVCSGTEATTGYGVVGPKTHAALIAATNV